ncbi:MAG TPA: Nramp family divalent metal transporter [Burkholderiales bacterium]|jgi:NRAMP (natural resistance-associated macrophage protein)-like metal ion transporter|nr:Nramp family divalent metal transporter [Burkholderiales bacterium]
MVPSETLPAEREPGAFRRWLKSLGPGLVTGAADDDPSGIGTYSVAGAALGFATLWTAVVTLPLMTVVQFLCNKIGMVTGRGLAGVLRRHYSRKVLYPAVLGLLVANTINVGADLGAIAAGINLVVPVPQKLMIVLVAVAIVTVQVWGHYRMIVTLFKWLTLSLFAYVAAALIAKPDWSEVLRATFIPTLRFDHEYLTTLLAILGTTISPYLFFWQASQEVEEEISQGKTTAASRKGTTDRELERAKLDTITGMFFCNLIFYFVILACAATLHASGNTEINSAADAAAALRPVAGSAATYLFAVGIVGAGFLAVPVLSGSSAYAIAETFGWKYGLDAKPGEAKQFYAVIALSTLVGVLIDFIGINPIRALFWTAVINGVLSPPLLVLIMLISGNRRIMGERANGRFATIAGWLATAVMFAAAIGMVVTWQ